VKKIYQMYQNTQQKRILPERVGTEQFPAWRDD